MNTEEAAHKPSCFQIHEDSISSSVAYISQHALSVKSVYVRAVATYALTLHDPNSMISFQLISSLENLARQKGVCVGFFVSFFLFGSLFAEWQFFELLFDCFLDCVMHLL